MSRIDFGGLHCRFAPPLSFGHFPRGAGETLPLGRPFTLTLALSHRGRGDSVASLSQWIPAFAGMT